MQDAGEAGHVTCDPHAEMDGVTEEVARGPSWRVDRRFAGAIRHEPGAVRAGLSPLEIGDGGDHSPPESELRSNRCMAGYGRFPRRFREALDAAI